MRGKVGRIILKGIQIGKTAEKFVSGKVFENPEVSFPKCL
jgi:hypothetical protein